MTACDSTRSNVAARNGRAMPSASAKCRLREAALAAEPDAGVLEPIGGIDADDQRGFFGERQRHAAAAAAGVEHAAAHGDAGPLEKRDDLGAAVVLEQRVVVFGAEAQVGVRLDGALVNAAHARSRRAAAGADPNLSMSAARSWPVVVSATSNVMMMRWSGYASSTSWMTGFRACDS